jgi:large repetitive protein
MNDIRTLLAGAIALACAGTASAQSFDSRWVSGMSLTNATSLQFGPDQRLYVSEQRGLLRAYTISRSENGAYSVTTTEVIENIRSGIRNHDDDGGPCSTECNQRQVTGLLVAGSANEPVLYVSSSDVRISVDVDSGLDTNSSIISRLTCSGGIVAGKCQEWEHVDIVRGLPRSEENHAANGMSLDATNNILYLAVGGNANMGAPSGAFAGTPEYFLAGAILSIDLGAIAAIETANGGPFTDQRSGARFVYDLPTLDDPTRDNIDNSHPDFPYEPGHPWHGRSIDPGDPFGGNNGLNQAFTEPSGPVQIHSPGYRNPYDVLYTTSGELYTWDNGPNSGWGGRPLIHDSAGTVKGWHGQSGVSYQPDAGDYCSNTYNEGGSATIGDVLKLITAPGFYGGHPAPIRAFPALSGIIVYTKDAANKWVQDGPVRDFTTLLPADGGMTPAHFPDDPRQCEYSLLDGALEVITHSTNGLAEYTASSFGGAMQGDLLAASFNGNIYRCKPDGAGGLVALPGNSPGTANGLCQALIGGLNTIPLDVTAVGDDGPFPGTIWIAHYLAGSIQVFEPAAITCDPANPGPREEDADNDGYTNGDELDNGTDPCNAGSIPPDFDGDFVSDLNDPDDDGDGILDVEDPFALDADNGLTTSIPLHYPLFNNNPARGLFGLGFTGLMLPGNGADTWLELFDSENLTAGGAAGRLTIDAVDAGDAAGNIPQRHGFLFGVAVDRDTPPFVARTRIVPPYFEIDGEQTTPVPGQGYGVFIGSGMQDSFLRLVINSGGIGVLLATPGGGTSNQFGSAAWGGQNLLDAAEIDLHLAVNPQALTAQPRVSLDGGTTVHDLGGPIAIPEGWFERQDYGMAVGVISTAGAAPEYGATWDLIEVVYDIVTSQGTWGLVKEGDEIRHEHAFVQVGSRFYMVGGRESDNVRIYDPATATWSQGAASPIKLHHFQAVALDGLIYVVGAMTGNCCAEPPAPNVYIYNPLADRWTTGPQIPLARRRGGGGAIAVGGKIYWVSGNTNGHMGPVSAQVDVFDPATGEFSALAAMPNPRDHFFIEHQAGKLYAVAGRRSNGTVNDTVTAVDVYDIASNSWNTLPPSSNLPTPRAGAASGIIGNELIVAGGESGSTASAHAQTEALDLQTLTWRSLSDMRTARHGTQAIVSNNGMYIAGGSSRRGGPTSTPLAVEVLHLFGATPPSTSTVTAGTLVAPAGRDLGSVAVGASVGGTLQLSNTGGNQALVIESLTINGSSAFNVTSPSLPVVIAPGGTATVALQFAPLSTGSHTADLVIAVSGSTARLVALTGHGAGDADAVVLYRVNVGGPQAASADGSMLPWMADTAAAPSAFLAGGGNQTASITDGSSYPGPINMSHPSLPTSVPVAVFETERWDPLDANPMRWSFPIDTPSTLQVRLYFSEMWWGITAPGERVFSVVAEDDIPLAFVDIDPFATAGANGASMRVATVQVTDGGLDLEFVHDIQNPALKGIEVIRTQVATRIFADGFEAR